MKLRVLSTIAALLAALIAFAAAIVYPSNPGKLWPNGIVPYVWGPDISGENQLKVLAAMQIWEDVTNVEFVLRDDESGYLFIRNAPENSNGDPGGSSSSVGRTGDKQNLNIRISGVGIYGIAHEIGHALGLNHTMQRIDRDDFLEWYPERTIEGGIDNFDIETSSLAWPRDEMDYASLMSYARCTFANCSADTGVDCKNNTATEIAGCRTLRILHPTAAAEFDTAMGQRSYLTRIDRLGMSFLYPEPGWRFVEAGLSGSSESGTFYDPHLEVGDAADDAPVGATLWIQPGDYPKPATRISKAMTLRAPLGRVRIAGG